MPTATACLLNMTHASHVITRLEWLEFLADVGDLTTKNRRI